MNYYSSEKNAFELKTYVYLISRSKIWGRVRGHKTFAPKEH